MIHPNEVPELWALDAELNVAKASFLEARRKAISALAEYKRLDDLAEEARERARKLEEELGLDAPAALAAVQAADFAQIQAGGARADSIVAVALADDAHDKMSAARQSHDDAVLAAREKFRAEGRL